MCSAGATALCGQRTSLCPRSLRTTRTRTNPETRSRSQSSRARQRSVSLAPFPFFFSSCTCVTCRVCIYCCFHTGAIVHTIQEKRILTRAHGRGARTQSNFRAPTHSHTKTTLTVVIVPAVLSVMCVRACPPTLGRENAESLALASKAHTHIYAHTHTHTYIHTHKKKMQITHTHTHIEHVNAKCKCSCENTPTNTHILNTYARVYTRLPLQRR